MTPSAARIYCKNTSHSPADSQLRYPQFMRHGGVLKPASILPPSCHKRPAACLSFLCSLQCAVSIEHLGLFEVLSIAFTLIPISEIMGDYAKLYEKIAKFWLSLAKRSQEHLLEHSLDCWMLSKSCHRPIMYSSATSGMMLFVTFPSYPMLPIFCFSRDSAFHSKSRSFCMHAERVQDSKSRFHRISHEPFHFILFTGCDCGSVEKFCQEPCGGNLINAEADTEHRDVVQPILTCAGSIEPHHAP